MNDVGLGLVVAAVLYGFRHGFDFDHLAAIGVITGSTGDRRRALRLSTLYVSGHALVILVLGIAAIAAGAFVPESLDAVMGRVVGITLIALGLYLAYSVVRYRSNVRFRSRWMLAADGVRALATKMRKDPQRVVIEHSHDHSHDATHEHDHDGSMSPWGSRDASTITRHAHAHTHVAAMPVDPFRTYSTRAAFGIGMIHGIGAETPSQVLLFASAAGAGSALGGSAVLVAFLVGLIAANSIVAVVSAVGFGKGPRVPRLYLTVAIVTAVFSLALGLSYAFGRSDLIPF